MLSTNTILSVLLWERGYMYVSMLLSEVMCSLYCVNKGVLLLQSCDGRDRHTGVEDDGPEHAPPRRRRFPCTCQPTESATGPASQTCQTVVMCVGAGRQGAGGSVTSH